MKMANTDGIFGRFFSKYRQAFCQKNRLLDFIELSSRLRKKLAFGIYRQTVARQTATSSVDRSPWLAK
jgi:hypothetical protein